MFRTSSDSEVLVPVACLLSISVSLIHVHHQVSSHSIGTSQPVQVTFIGSMHMPLVTLGFNPWLNGLIHQEEVILAVQVMMKSSLASRAGLGGWNSDVCFLGEAYRNIDVDVNHIDYNDILYIRCTALFATSMVTLLVWTSRALRNTLNFCDGLVDGMAQQLCFFLFPTYGG